MPWRRLDNPTITLPAASPGEPLPPGYYSAVAAYPGIGWLLRRDDRPDRAVTLFTLSVILPMALIGTMLFAAKVTAITRHTDLGEALVRLIVGIIIHAWGAVMVTWLGLRARFLPHYWFLPLVPLIGTLLAFSLVWGGVGATRGMLYTANLITLIYGFGSLCLNLGRWLEWRVLRLCLALPSADDIPDDAAYERDWRRYIDALLAHPKRSRILLRGPIPLLPVIAGIANGILLLMLQARLIGWSYHFLQAYLLAFPACGLMIGIGRMPRSIYLGVLGAELVLLAYVFTAGNMYYMRSEATLTVLPFLVIGAVGCLFWLIRLARLVKLRGDVYELMYH